MRGSRHTKDGGREKAPRRQLEPLERSASITSLLGTQRGRLRSVSGSIRSKSRLVAENISDVIVRSISRDSSGKSKSPSKRTNNRKDAGGQHLIFDRGKTDEGSCETLTEHFERDGKLKDRYYDITHDTPMQDDGRMRPKPPFERSDTDSGSRDSGQHTKSDQSRLRSSQELIYDSPESASGTSASITATQQTERLGRKANGPSKPAKPRYYDTGSDSKAVEKQELWKSRGDIDAVKVDTERNRYLGETLQQYQKQLHILRQKRFRANPLTPGAAGSRLTSTTKPKHLTTLLSSKIKLEPISASTSHLSEPSKPTPRQTRLPYVSHNEVPPVTLKRVTSLSRQKPPRLKSLSDLNELQKNDDTVITETIKFDKRTYKAKYDDPVTKDERHESRSSSGASSQDTRSLDFSSEMTTSATPTTSTQHSLDNSATTNEKTRTSSNTSYSSSNANVLSYSSFSPGEDPQSTMSILTSSSGKHTQSMRSSSNDDYEIPKRQEIESSVEAPLEMPPDIRGTNIPPKPPEMRPNIIERVRRSRTRNQSTGQIESLESQIAAIRAQSNTRLSRSASRSANEAAELAERFRAKMQSHASASNHDSEPPYRERANRAKAVSSSQLSSIHQSSAVEADLAERSRVTRYKYAHSLLPVSPTATGQRLLHDCGQVQQRTKSSLSGHAPGQKPASSRCSENTEPLVSTTGRTATPRSSTVAAAASVNINKATDARSRRDSRACHMSKSSQRIFGRHAASTGGTRIVDQERRVGRSLQRLPVVSKGGRGDRSARKNGQLGDFDPGGSKSAHCLNAEDTSKLVRRKEKAKAGLIDYQANHARPPGTTSKGQHLQRRLSVSADNKEAYTKTYYLSSPKEMPSITPIYDEPAPPPRRSSLSSTSTENMSLVLEKSSRAILERSSRYESPNSRLRNQIGAPSRSTSGITSPNSEDSYYDERAHEQISIRRQQFEYREGRGWEPYESIRSTVLERRYDLSRDKPEEKSTRYKHYELDPGGAPEIEYGDSRLLPPVSSTSTTNQLSRYERSCKSGIAAGSMPAIPLSHISTRHHHSGSNAGLSKQQFKAARRNSKGKSSNSRRQVSPLRQMNLTQESFAALMEQTGLEDDEDSRSTSMKDARSTSGLIATPLRYIERSDIDFRSVLNAGSFGEVHHGYWRSEHLEVAVKVEKRIDENEAKIWSTLSHKNIARFYGVVKTETEFWLVLELVKEGDLYHLLHGQDHIHLSIAHILNMTQGIAKGINYLHYEAPERVIHRDLKSLNILIANYINFTPKICDFGGSRFLPKTKTMNGQVGTFPWMAPEIIQGKGRNEKCDTFSFGIILWEIVTRLKPYPGFNMYAIAYNVVVNEMRPYIPTCMPKPIRRLIMSCWQGDPEIRLDIREVLERIIDLKKDDHFLDAMNNFLEMRHIWKSEVDDIKIQEGDSRFENDTLKTIKNEIHVADSDVDLPEWISTLSKTIEHHEGQNNTREISQQTSFGAYTTFASNHLPDSGVFASTHQRDQHSPPENSSSGTSSSIDIETIYMNQASTSSSIRNIQKQSTLYATTIRRKIYNRHDISFTNHCGKRAKLMDILELGLVSEETVQRLEYGELNPGDLANASLRPYLKGEDPIEALIDCLSGERMSIIKAAKSGIISRGIAFSLLEAQAATGNILVDYPSKRRMSPSDALHENYLEQTYKQVLRRAERSVHGFGDRGQCLSIYEAVVDRLIPVDVAKNILEVQLATGGVIDPRMNVRLPEEMAIKRGLLDKRLVFEIGEKKSYINPNTDESVSYAELMKTSIVDGSTGIRCLTLFPRSLDTRVSQEPGLLSPETRMKSKSLMLTQRERIGERRAKLNRFGEASVIDADEPTCLDKAPDPPGTTRHQKLSLHRNISQPISETGDIDAMELYTRRVRRLQNSKHNSLGSKTTSLRLAPKVPPPGDRQRGFFPDVLPEADRKSYHELRRKFQGQNKRLALLIEQYKDAADTDAAYRLTKLQGITGQALTLLQTLQKNCQSPPEIAFVNKRFEIPQINPKVPENQMCIEVRQVAHRPPTNLSESQKDISQKSGYVVIKLPAFAAANNAQSTSTQTLQFKTKCFKSFDQIMHLERVLTPEPRDVKLRHFVKHSAIIFEVWQVRKLKRDKLISYCNVGVDEFCRRSTIEKTVDLIENASSGVASGCAKTVGSITVKIAVRRPLDCLSTRVDEEFVYLLDREKEFGKFLK